jgi:hypothetical protein
MQERGGGEALGEKVVFLPHGDGPPGFVACCKWREGGREGGREEGRGRRERSEERRKLGE